MISPVFDQFSPSGERKCWGRKGAVSAAALKRKMAVGRNDFRNLFILVDVCDFECAMVCMYI